MLAPPLRALTNAVRNREEQRGMSETAGADFWLGPSPGV